MSTWHPSWAQPLATLSRGPEYCACHTDSSRGPAATRRAATLSEPGARKMQEKQGEKWRTRRKPMTKPIFTNNHVNKLYNAVKNMKHDGIWDELGQLSQTWQWILRIVANPSKESMGQKADAEKATMASQRAEEVQDSSVRAKSGSSVHARRGSSVHATHVSCSWTAPCILLVNSQST